jgi:peptidoglycan/xylan/chitin deacetylase (PgdA/CDA1 family)
MSALVLFYHRVAEHERDPFGLCTPPARFRAQLACLAERFCPMELDELVADAPERGVAVTLDDGYRDALDAAQLLREERVPATFFLNSDRLDTPHEAWWDELASLFSDGGALPNAFGALPTETADQRVTAMRALHDRLLFAPAAEREALLAELRAWAPGRPPRDSHRLLLADEVRRLAGSGFAVGAHGERHLWLPSQTAAEREREVRGCQQTLEALLGAPVDRYSYAYGGHDDDAVATVRAAGFQLAVTVAERGVQPDDDRLRIPRLAAPALDGAAFAAWLERALTPSR